MRKMCMAYCARQGTFWLSLPLSLSPVVLTSLLGCQGVVCQGCLSPRKLEGTSTSDRDNYSISQDVNLLRFVPIVIWQHTGAKELAGFVTLHHKQKGTLETVTCEEKGTFCIVD